MRILAILAAAAMVASLFLPWMSLAPLAPGGLVPWDLVKEIDLSMDGLRQLTATLPWQALLLLATFPLAALFLLLALVGLPVRLLAIVAGGIPIAAIAYAIWDAYSDAQSAAAVLGVEVPTGDLVGVLRSATEHLSFGAWAWGVGAIILFLTGLIGYGRRR